MTPWVALAGAAAVAVSIAIWSYGYREEKVRGRGVAAVLRGTAVFLVLASPWLPSAGVPGVDVRRTAILLDRSASMRLPADSSAGTSRMSVARDSVIALKRNHGDPPVWAFAGSVALQEESELARLEAVKRSTTVVLTFNPGGPQSGNYTVFVDDGSGGGTADNLIQDNMQEETLARTIMPFGVTLTGTTFAADRTGYNSRGFPVGATFTDTEGKVTVANNNRSYEVTLQRTSGGLSLDGPL